MAYISFQPKDQFTSKLYTGTGSTQTLTGLDFEPVFSWIKNRSSARSHRLVDTLRGIYTPDGFTKTIYSDNNGGQDTDDNAQRDFTSDGFIVGSENGVNESGDNIVGWNWKGGSTTIPSGSTATVSSYSINPTSGFGMYKYTDATPAGKIIKHGLGRTPQFLIVKNYGGSHDWACYHSRIDGNLANAGNYFIRLNTNEVSSENSGYFDNTVTTDTDITLGADNPVGGSGQTIIMYAFCNVPGFSRMGSYFGGSRTHGPFVYTGFKPAFVMIKSTAGVYSWVMLDGKISPTNQASKEVLFANSSQHYGTYTTVDFLSNGFKLRSGDASLDPDGGNMIYMAFAEHPLISSNGKSATAR